MTPSLSAFLSSVFLAVIIVVIPISAALVFVSSSDKILRGAGRVRGGTRRVCQGARAQRRRPRAETVDAQVRRRDCT